MAMYIYRTDGEPVGFRFSNFIHDLDGTPLGRILGTHVYRLDGSYVGELFKESVVDKPAPSARSIQPVAAPASLPSPGASFRRRGVVDYGFHDLFDRLREAPQGPACFDDPMAIAAE